MPNAALSGAALDLLEAAEETVAALGHLDSWLMQQLRAATRPKERHHDRHPGLVTAANNVRSAGMHSRSQSCRCAKYRRRMKKALEKIVLEFEDMFRGLDLAIAVHRQGQRRDTMTKGTHTGTVGSNTER